MKLIATPHAVALHHSEDRLIEAMEATIVQERHSLKAAFSPTYPAIAKLSISSRTRIRMKDQGNEEGAKLSTSSWTRSEAVKNDQKKKTYC